MSVHKSIPHTVNKAVAAIHIKNDISCLQRKLWNVLLSSAYKELPNLDIQMHEIRVKDLMHEVGFDSKNIQYLKDALEKLVTTKLTWNILDEKGKQEWGVSAALASASIFSGICTYSYSAHLRQKLYNPDMYAPIPLGVLRRFSSGHTIALYENGLRYKFIGETPWLELSVFRDLLGVGNNVSYDDFKVLNRAVIKPAILEVNTVSDINLSVELKREHRKVISIKFRVGSIRQESLPIESTDDFNRIILARLIDTICLTERQAKEILATHSEEKITSVMDYVEQRYKDGKILQGKIAPYFIRTLPKFDNSNTVSSIDREKREDANKLAKIAKSNLEKQVLIDKLKADRDVIIDSFIKDQTEDSTNELLVEFSTMLQLQNKYLFQTYKKSGLSSKSVSVSFKLFISKKILPPIDQAIAEITSPEGLLAI